MGGRPDKPPSNTDARPCWGEVGCTTHEVEPEDLHDPLSIGP